MSARAAIRPRLDLPPAYTLVTLRETGDAHAHACRIAPEAGAGTLVHVGRFDLVEVAVVLEPEEPLRTARRAFLAGMAAVADAIAAHCPPEKSVEFAFPDAIRYDAALIGGGRLGWPDGCPEDEVPPWMVFSAMLIAARVGLSDAGFAPLSTSLEEEGFDDTRPLVESFARHLMVWFDAWGAEGFTPVANAYLGRLPKRKAGERRGIDGNGDLLLHPAKGPVERVPLLPGLLAPSWYDPARRGPRL